MLCMLDTGLQGYCCLSPRKHHDIYEQTVCLAGIWFTIYSKMGVNGSQQYTGLPLKGFKENRYLVHTGSPICSTPFLFKLIFSLQPKCSLSQPEPFQIPVLPGMGEHVTLSPSSNDATMDA